MPRKAVEARPRCAIYARVSTVEQREEGFSIDAQLSLLRDYASKKGMIVAGEFVDSESGSRTGRTQFGKMLALVAAGGASAIVVEKVDRLYRNFADLVKVDDLGAELHFVKEGQIIGPDSRSSDKLIHGVKVVLAKHFSDNLKEEVAKGMTEKAKQGLFPSRAPVGYLNVRRGTQKVIEVDPEKGPLVRKVFELYGAGGASIDDAADYAKRIGLVTPRGDPHSRSHIARMLDNPVYAGVVRWNGEDYPGRHEPIISLALWQRVQEIMHGRTTRAGSGPREFTYRGLMKCGYCGCFVTAEIKKERYVYYRCTGRKDPKCPGKKFVPEARLTEQFASLLDGLVLNDRQLEDLKTALRQSLAEETKFRSEALDRIDREEKTLRDRLERMYLDKIAGDVDEDVYRSLSQKTKAQLAELEVKRSALGKAEAGYYDLGERVLELAQTAPLRFKRADDATKREIMLELLESCVLRDGKVQVSLREPFQTILNENVRRLENGAADAENETWYSGRDSNPRSSP